MLEDKIAQLENPLVDKFKNEAKKAFKVGSSLTKTNSSQHRRIKSVRNKDKDLFSNIFVNPR